ncbi:hypothetical protein [Kamptonema formosum]|nr:hypothetical protein [Oscillatoria sp. PCC 10802]
MAGSEQFSLYITIIRAASVSVPFPGFTLTGWSKRAHLARNTPL